jgi:hypothetical protein
MSEGISGEEERKKVVQSEEHQQRITIDSMLTFMLRLESVESSFMDPVRGREPRKKLSKMRTKTIHD